MRRRATASGVAFPGESDSHLTGYICLARATVLTTLEQDILDLRLQGLNDKEIALALGRTHGAIRTVQYRMIRKLRAHIDQSIPAPEKYHDQA